MKRDPIGRLRTRIRIEGPARIDEDAGGATITWSALATVWAHVEPLSGNETFDAAAHSARLTHRVTLRHFAGLTPTHRLLLGTRVLDIRSIRSPDEGGRWMICNCEERVS